MYIRRYLLVCTDCTTILLHSITLHYNTINFTLCGYLFCFCFFLKKTICCHFTFTHIVFSVNFQAMKVEWYTEGHFMEYPTLFLDFSMQLPLWFQRHYVLVGNSPYFCTFLWSASLISLFKQPPPSYTDSTV